VFDEKTYEYLGDWQEKQTPPSLSRWKWAFALRSDSQPASLSGNFDSRLLEALCKSPITTEASSVG
jgi:hypothetical protein